MSLDAKIKELATAKLRDLKTEAIVALGDVESEFGVTAEDIGRIVSGHKTKTTEAKLIKQFSEEIGEAMLASLRPRAEHDEIG